MRISRELWRTAYIQVAEKGFIKEGNKKRTFCCGHRREGVREDALRSILSC